MVDLSVGEMVDLMDQQLAAKTVEMMDGIRAELTAVLSADVMVEMMDDLLVAMTVDW